MTCAGCFSPFRVELNAGSAADAAAMAEAASAPELDAAAEVGVFGALVASVLGGIISIALDSSSPLSSPWSPDRTSP
jgi:hypothetical protein